MSFAATRARIAWVCCLLLLRFLAASSASPRQRPSQKHRLCWDPKRSDDASVLHPPKEEKPPVVASRASRGHVTHAYEQSQQLTQQPPQRPHSEGVQGVAEEAETAAGAAAIDGRGAATAAKKQHQANVDDEEGQVQERGETETPSRESESLCVGIERMFAAVVAPLPRRVAASSTEDTVTWPVEERMERDLTRACTCAAAAFICRGPAEVTARLMRQTEAKDRQRAQETSQRTALGGAGESGHDPAAFAVKNNVVETTCGVPCEVPETCGGSAGSDSVKACVGPVCEHACALCVEEAAGVAGTDDIPLENLVASCGVENACLCSQCLESGLLTKVLPSPTIDGAFTAGQLSRFGGYGGGYGGGGQWGYNPYRGGGAGGPGYGGYGAGPTFGPYAGTGAYPGGYPGYSYPAGAIGYYMPWCVTIFDKTKAFIVSSICYWYPFHPSCIPRRPIPIPKPTPPMMRSPPPNGQPPSPAGTPPSPAGGLTCGDPSLGEQTCSGIPCTGDATCTTTTPQCCCDASCVEFGDCCADQVACCGTRGVGRDNPFGRPAALSLITGSRRRSVERVPRQAKTTVAASVSVSQPWRPAHAPVTVDGRYQTQTPRPAATETSAVLASGSIARFPQFEPWDTSESNAGASVDVKEEGQLLEDMRHLVAGFDVEVDEGETRFGGAEAPAPGPGAASDDQSEEEDEADV